MSSRHVVLLAVICVQFLTSATGDELVTTETNSPVIVTTIDTIATTIDKMDGMPNMEETTVAEESTTREVLKIRREHDTIKESMEKDAKEQQQGIQEAAIRQVQSMEEELEQVR